MDVGGSLWPDRLTGPLTDEQCLAQIAALWPELDAEQCLDALHGALRTDYQLLVQDTHSVLGEALQALGVHRERDRVVAIRRAVCAPDVPGIALFPGAHELLETIRELGLRWVVVSSLARMPSHPPAGWTGSPLCRSNKAHYCLTEPAFS